MQSTLASEPQTFVSSGRTYSLYSLPAVERELGAPVKRLPVSLRIVLESLLRHCGEPAVSAEDVARLAGWSAKKPAFAEIPFTVARILLQDFTGVPLVVDLAAMRSAADRLGNNPRLIEPVVPVELVVDHSVQVDFAGTPHAFHLNLAMEFKRNRERYEFLKWGEQAFNNFTLVPPGIGIVHQVNLEYLARGVFTSEQDDGSTLVYPDTLVGTDSHTTMINGLGIVGWGVGGIEAEAGMLGQPIYLLTPEVVGVHLSGHLREGVTATDLVLRITEMLRKAKVVGKFVEFFGEGARSLSVPDRATIGNMAPEYGATIGFFPVDEETLHYLRLTGRSEEQVSLVRDYFTAQEMFGIPAAGEVDYSATLELDLNTVEASVAGPRRPQDRIPLPEVKDVFLDLLSRPIVEGGYGKDSRSDGRTTVMVDVPTHQIKGGGSQEPIDPAIAAEQETSLITEQEMANNRPTPDPVATDGEREERVICPLRHGSVVIAAITSCTNTSNPSVMLAAGLLARNAVERGLRVSSHVKASLAPGSRVVTEYFRATGLQPYLDQLRFHLVGYGCTTCIGNSGPLPEALEAAIEGKGLIVASVLSGNRNFEARIHAAVRGNFLMSPPLVVAFALAGRIDIDMTSEPLGLGDDGKPVYLRDIWPSLEQIHDAMKMALQPEVFQRLYRDFSSQNPEWNSIPSATGELYAWNAESTYIQEPPFFKDFSTEPRPLSEITKARALAIFGDSITTDHISPAGSIKPDSPAGRYLRERGVPIEEFNSYGARRGNDRVMTRGTFANLRIRNRMVPGIEGGYTCNLLSESCEAVPIYEAAQLYAAKNIPLIVFGGKEYGTGSSRDWAAKGTRLLGVRAVIAESFERIHRSNLVGMGILPCVFEEGISAQKLKIDGSEAFSIRGLGQNLEPRAALELKIERRDGSTETVPITARIDTPVEVKYYLHGGILQYVLRKLISS